MKNYLNFEKEIKELDEELEKLKDPYNQGGISEVDTQKISKTEDEINEKLGSIYSNLDPWQTTMVARHEDRPKSKFFIENLFTDFISFEIVSLPPIPSMASTMTVSCLLKSSRSTNAIK